MRNLQKKKKSFEVWQNKTVWVFVCLFLKWEMHGNKFGAFWLWRPGDSLHGSDEPKKVWNPFATFDNQTCVKVFKPLYFTKGFAMRFKEPKLIYTKLYSVFADKG